MQMINREADFSRLPETVEKVAEPLFRMGSNALLGKAFSERSEDFSAAQRRESNGIFGKSGIDFFRPSGIV